jgi:hypothetical protein
MPWVGFEPTIPAFEGARTFHALDRAATVISKLVDQQNLIQQSSENISAVGGHY